MDNTIVKLANTFSNELMEQIYIGKRDINIIARILKVIMQGDIVPVRAEIAKATNVPEGTVKSYIKFLKKHEIFIGPEIEEFVVTNRETGEIVKDYKKKKAAYVYYDIKAEVRLYVC